MYKIYICSPLRGDVTRNQILARKYCKKIIDGRYGWLPVCPHIYFTQFMDDNDIKDRQEAMRLNKKLIDECDELWVCTNVITEGMQEEINYALNNDKRVEFKADYFKGIKCLERECAQADKGKLSNENKNIIKKYLKKKNKKELINLYLEKLDYYNTEIIKLKSKKEKENG